MSSAARKLELKKLDTASAFKVNGGEGRDREGIGKTGKRSGTPMLREEGLHGGIVHDTAPPMRFAGDFTHDRQCGVVRQFIVQTGHAFQVEGRHVVVERTHAHHERDALQIAHVKVGVVHVDRRHEQLRQEGVHERVTYSCKEGDVHAHLNPAGGGAH